MRFVDYFCIQAFRWGELNKCYQGVLRRLLTCLAVHFISKTLVCIDLNWVKLLYTIAVSWTWALKNLMNACWRNHLRKPHFHCFWYMWYTGIDTPETFELSAQFIVHTNVSLMSYSEVILKWTLKYAVSNWCVTSWNNWLYLRQTKRRE